MCTITGLDIANAAFSDVDSFFYHSTKFEVKRELNVSGMREHASYAGTNENSRIKLSSDLCAFEALTLEDYFFVLLIVCHELAHYLNFHNAHKDQGREDKVSIEARADNFGAQIFLVLITFGKSTKRNINKINGNLNQELLTVEIAKGLGRLYQQVYTQNSSRFYPKAEHRVLLTVSGFLSFFNRYFGRLEKHWTVRFVLEIIRNGTSGMMDGDPDVVEEAEKVSKRIDTIHRDLQRGNSFMIKGMKPLFGYFVLSNFDVSNSERESHRARLLEMVEGFTDFQ